MKFVSSLKEANAAASKVSEMKFDKAGNQTTNQNEKFYAKMVVKNGITAYSIKTYNNELFDPQGVYSHREHILETKMEIVNKETFDFYMVYLSTRKGIYFLKAQRSYLNA